MRRARHNSCLIFEALQRFGIFGSILLVSGFLYANVALSTESADLAGKLLVANPETKDPRFAESVIYMIKHDAGGAMGLVINKPITTAPIDELLKSFGRQEKHSKREIVVHYGGPVGARQGFILHSDEFLLENSQKIADGIAMTADAKMLDAIADGKGPRQSLFILGYAGWAPGQIEAELGLHAWIVIPGDRALIFGDNADKKWRQAIDKQQVPL
jgi:putative transcriptional regulator